MPFVRQSSFAAGELSPYLWGRTDLGLYAAGLRRCRDFFVTRQGVLLSRPGTRYVATASAVNPPPGARLLPFVFSDTQSYVLELGHFYIRVVTGGSLVMASYMDFTGSTGTFDEGVTVTGGTSGAHAVVVRSAPVGTAGRLQLSGIVGTFVGGEALTSSSGSATASTPGNYITTYVIQTTYSRDQLSRLQYVQSGDILTITHPSHAPRELRRYANDDWRLADVSFARLYPWAQDLEGPGVQTFNPCIVLPTPGEDSTHPAREWRYRFSATAQHTATGRIIETRAYDVILAYNGTDYGASGTGAPTSFVLYPDKAVTLRRPAHPAPGAPPAEWTGYKPLAYNFYRGRGEAFGYIGQTKTRDFVDTGGTPDYAIQPLAGTHPFKVYNQAGTLVRTETPAAVAYYQERLVFGGTSYRKATVFLSATGDYLNFDKRMALSVHGEALEYELASRKLEDIRSLWGKDWLFIFTGSSVWRMGGVQGSPLDFDSVDARVVEEVGAGFLPPLYVDGGLLYVRAKGTGVRVILPANTEAGFVGQDATLTAPHLFAGSGGAIVDWCFAEDPHGLVWATRADGKLLSLTYSPQGELLAWAQHTTGPDDIVESVCSVPEGSEDAVYLLVRRYTRTGGPGSEYAWTRYLERMSSRTPGAGTSDGLALDCSLTYTGGTATTLSGLNHLEGREVYVTGKGQPVMGPFVVTSGIITLPGPVTPSPSLHVGLLYQPELETLDVLGKGGSARNLQKTTVSVGFEVDHARGLSVGQDTEHLEPASAGGGLLDGWATEPDNAPHVAHVRGTWDKGARAVLRQTLPLFVSVFGITREVDVGE